MSNFSESGSCFQSRGATCFKFLHAQKQLEAQIARYTKEICLSDTCPNLVLCFFVLFKLGAIIQLSVASHSNSGSMNQCFIHAVHMTRVHLSQF